MVLFAPTLAAAATSTAPTQSATPPPRATPTPSPTETPQEAQVDFYIKIPDIEGDSGDAKPTASSAPDQVNTKPQEGVEPDEIDYDGGDQPLTPDFSILLGGGSGDDAEGTEASRQAVEEILKQGMDEQSAPTEQISLNYEEIKLSVREEVKVFGVIPVVVTANVEVDGQGRVKVKFPWWAFLASGKDSDEVGDRVFTALSNVLKTRHDTIKNAIQNVR